ncbi:hybrid sensor histidine kinase/response regulator [Caldimonas tepidiphila]|uniref:hybrid sensor histidine kinase/response regulator n=1 Tax=Caldimonas tepidiphila TaxID=2315841 RepID=UPI000E5A8992|nr:ATP-binding protein [Caldimonas tepidiphila]
MIAEHREPAEPIAKGEGGPGRGLSRAAGLQALLLDVGRRLLRAAPDEAASALGILERLAEPLGVDLCLHYRHEPASGRLEQVAAVGVPPALAGGLRRLDSGSARGAQALVDAQQAALAGLGLLGPGGLLQGWACHALEDAEGRVTGTFALGRRHGGAFAEDEAGFIRSLCEWVALEWERAGAERALARREAQLRVALDAGRLGTWWRDLETGEFHMDERARLHFGFDVASVSLQEQLARVHPLDAPRLEAEVAAVERMAPGAQLRGIEYRVLRPDGGVRWLSVEAKVFLQPGSGSRRMCVGTSADITGRKRIERALRETADDLERAQAVASIGSWRFYAPSGRLYWTTEVYRIFGLPLGTEVDYERFLAAVHPEDRAMIDEHWQAALASGGPYEVEHRIVVGSEVKWVSERAELEFGPEGQFLSGFGTVQDITARKAQEAALRRIAEELAEADRRKDEFLATLAHELRNPLGPLRNAAQLLRMEAGDPALLQRTGAVVERQVSHLARLIDDLLDVSRITRGKLELRCQGVTLREIVDGALEGSLALIESHRHALTVHLPAEELPLEGDPVRLVQVFQNLLDNAAKYTPAGGRIVLSARVDGTCVEVSVRDNGIGIPLASIGRLFELFYQVDRSIERARSGLGIGLTLVERLVRMHGGTVEARSAGSELGSEFLVRLPLAEPPSATRTAQPGAMAAPASAHRILVADDNVDSAESMALLLQLSGHEVHVAYDGQQALQMAERLRPTMLLVDIGMPRLNGYEVARRIRASDWGRSARLVAQTGWGQQEDMRRSREAGFDAHLTKPVDIDALMRLLAQAPAPGPLATQALPASEP